MNRRHFTNASLALAAATILPSTMRAANSPKSGLRYAAFIKYLHSLSYDELAEAIAAIGYDGIEATILHCLGIDHNRFTYPFRGLDTKLTGVEPSRVVEGILA